MTLIDDLVASTPEQLSRIAHNDAALRSSQVSIDSEDRTRLLNEKLAMSATAVPATNGARAGGPALHPPRPRKRQPSRRLVRSRTTATSGWSGHKATVSGGTGEPHSQGTMEKMAIILNEKKS